MIVVEASGRLGNLMFQYAFALAASRRLETTFAIDDRLLRTRFLAPAAEDPNEAPSYPVVRINNDDYDSPDDVLQQLRDSIHYRGYFQSEQFFAASADEVRDAFRV